MARKFFNETEEDKRERMRGYVRAYKQRNREKLRLAAIADPKAAARRQAYRQRHAAMIKERDRNYFKANKDRLQQRNRAWAEAHPERMRAFRAKYAQNNAIKCREAGHTYRAKYPERQRARRKAYDLANPGKKAATVAWRRASQKKATPPWLSHDQRSEIAAFYREARGLAAITGISHHVDHIVPLVGRSVCGLHVPWNLQVLTGAENLRKRNSL